VTAPTITLERVSVFYGEVVGLSQVDLNFAPGITGIVGPNGSGKTTLMRVLTGLLAPGEGAATVLGGSPFDRADIRTRVSFVPATECFHPALSGRRNLEVAFTARGYDRKTAKAMAVKGLELISLTGDGDRRYGTWSRGMRQRLKLGVALAAEPEIVLLDEPFLGVDPPSRRHLMDLVARLGSGGKTVVISSHVLHEIESLTDLVGILAHGRLLGMGRIHDLIRDLRDRHPHRLLIDTDDARALATELVGLPHVTEIAIDGGNIIEIITRQPDTAYREITGLIAKSGRLVRRLETLDNGLEAVFRHVTAGGTRRL
jgi:ABC-2 type transport system ATP-binding protein